MRKCEQSSLLSAAEDKLQWALWNLDQTDLLAA
jgi:hypothetical protein